jgi:2-dehydropantoate 2-reductase
MAETEWPTIAVMGAGAVGCFFGGMLARAGAPVTLVGRPHHVDAMTRNGLFLDSRDFRGFLPVSASTRAEAVRDAQIVLLCVKTRDTEHAARALAPHLAGEAVVVSLQNGVDNAERVRAATGIEAMPAVVYVAAEMTAPGCVKHNGRGDLVLGDLAATVAPSCARRARLDRVAALFQRAGVPCRLSDRIEAELWTKLIMNCACNAISALTRARYGRIIGNPLTRAVMQQVVEEAVALARAAGVRLEGADPIEPVIELAEAMPGALSSTAQDIARGKLTEIDALNGYVARRGLELGLATPVNQTLYALVKLLEESAAAAPSDPGRKGSS